MDRSNISGAAATALQWSYDTLWKHGQEGIVAIIDSDMFPIAEFSITEYLKDFDVAATQQKRGHVIYLWNSIMFFNIDMLPDKDNVNIMFGNVEGQATDVGGHLYYWLKNNPQLCIRNIIHTGPVCERNNNLEKLPSEIYKTYEIELPQYDHDNIEWLL